MKEKLTVHLIDSMKIYTVIPCRSGSKRIRNKNLYIFNDKTLLRNSIKITSNSIFQMVIVSTDSYEYLNKTKDFNIYDVGLRSRHLR